MSISPHSIARRFTRSVYSKKSAVNVGMEPIFVRKNYIHFQFSWRGLQIVFFAKEGAIIPFQYLRDVGRHIIRRSHLRSASFSKKSKCHSDPFRACAVLSLGGRVPAALPWEFSPLTVVQVPPPPPPCLPGQMRRRAHHRPEIAALSISIHTSNVTCI